MHVFVAFLVIYLTIEFVVMGVLLGHLVSGEISLKDFPTPKSLRSHCTIFGIFIIMLFLIIILPIIYFIKLMALLMIRKNIKENK